MPTTVAPECLAGEKLRVETENSTCRYFIYRVFNAFVDKNFKSWMPQKESSNKHSLDLPSFVFKNLSIVDFKYLSGARQRSRWE